MKGYKPREWGTLADVGGEPYGFKEGGGEGKRRGRGGAGVDIQKKKKTKESKEGEFTHQSASKGAAIV